MREVRKVLLAQSSLKLPSAQDAVACHRVTFNRGCAPAPKWDDMACAHNFFRRKGTKPILQVSVASQSEINDPKHYKSVTLRLPPI